MKRALIILSSLALLYACSSEAAEPEDNDDSDDESDELPASCKNGERDPLETDVDCGSLTGCRPCGDLDSCISDRDCESDQCDSYRAPDDSGTSTKCIPVGCESDIGGGGLACGDNAGGGGAGGASGGGTTSSDGCTDMFEGPDSSYQDRVVQVLQDPPDILFSRYDISGGSCTQLNACNDGNQSEFGLNVEAMGVGRGQPIVAWEPLGDYTNRFFVGFEDDGNCQPKFEEGMNDSTGVKFKRYQLWFLMQDGQVSEVFAMGDTLVGLQKGVAFVVEGEERADTIFLPSFTAGVNHVYYADEGSQPASAVAISDAGGGGTAGGDGGTAGSGGGMFGPEIDAQCTAFAKTACESICDCSEETTGQCALLNTSGDAAYNGTRTNCDNWAYLNCGEAAAVDRLTCIADWSLGACASDPMDADQRVWRVAESCDWL